MTEDCRLDIGCAAQHGVFEINYPKDEPSTIEVHTNTSPLAYFLLRLIARLQCVATVPCLDVMAYAHWIDANKS